MKVLGLILIALVLTALIIPIAVNIVTVFVVDLPKSVKYLLSTFIMPLVHEGGGDPIDSPAPVS